MEIMAVLGKGKFARLASEGNRRACFPCQRVYDSDALLIGYCAAENAGENLLAKRVVNQIRSRQIQNSSSYNVERGAQAGVVVPVLRSKDSRAILNVYRHESRPNPVGE